MKRKDIFDHIKKIENEDETLKKWGNLYEIEKEIIEVLTQTRIKKELTQKELAKITGLKQSAIARIENNVNSPQLDTIIKLVDALELKIDIKDKKIILSKANKLNPKSLDELFLDYKGTHKDEIVFEDTKGREIW